jgi:RNA polymerase sigma factor (sigma-70 family)
VTTPSQDVIHYLRSLVHCPSDAAVSDRELLRRFVKRRDNDAFAALLRRHGPMVLNLARRIIGDKQLAEDVFQATFLLLAQKGGGIRRPEALPCWLHGAARRLAVRVRSGQLRRQRQEAKHCLSSPSNPLDELTAQEFLTVLDDELAKLPENYRAPLILCCLQGLSQEEAAKRLGCSSGAVRGRLERGRQRLRLRLEKRGLTLPAVLGGTLLLAGATCPVPTALAQATLHSATIGSGIAPAVAALMEGALRSMFFHKWNVLTAAAMLLALCGTGVGMIALCPQAVTENTLSPFSLDDKSLSAKRRVDLHGDPLPDGAVMRLGTLQRRAVGAKLAVTADGKSIIAVRGGKYVSIWDAATGKLRISLQLPVSSVSESVLSPDGLQVLTGVYVSDDRLQLWDVRSVKLIRTLVMDGVGFIWPVVFSPDGKEVVAVGSAGKEHRVHIWDLSTGKITFRKTIRTGEAISRIAFTPDGKRLLVVVRANPPYLACWDRATGRQLWQVEHCDPYAMVCTPDDKVLLSDKVSARDLATGQPNTKEKCRPSPISTTWSSA